MTKKIAYFLIIASSFLIVHNIYESEPFKNSISSILVIISMLLIIWDRRKKNS